ncbi:hypothetical protein UFOVP1304_25 [uncultured Caudovirales phage]|uniref:Uncharacterized protein n=1 Tax=uncultured Caudovirales phage TaxID=2100421 RepID=A0A6J5RUC1_9CAUD|nr:hypothetical protein UFOVP1304_25 [uncultured Caudovirales phage]
MKIKQSITTERATVLDEIKSPLMTQTNLEIDSWVEANVTNLAQARTLFKKILKGQRNILRFLSRQEIQ